MSKPKLAEKPPVPSAPKWLAPLRDLLLFGLFFVFVLRRIEPPLQLHAQGALFYWGERFFRQMISKPGGGLEYLWGFLMQYHDIAWIGAVILTLIAFWLTWVIRRLLHSVLGYPVPVLALLPAALWAGLLPYYEYPVLQFGLGPLGALALAMVVDLWRSRPAWVRVPVGLVLGFCFYPVAGDYFLIYVATMAMREFLPGKRGIVPGLLYVVLGSLTPPLAAHLFYAVKPANAYLPLYWFPLPAPAWIMWIFVPCALLGLALLRRPLEWGTAASAGKGWRHRLSRVRRLARSETALWIKSGLLVLLAAAIVSRTFDANQQALIQVNFYARQKQWQPLLAAEQRVTARGTSTRLDVLRALYHTGRLPYDMFNYPQKRTAEMLPKINRDVRLWALPMVDALLDLGQVNYAEHWAHEALELLGDRPLLLQRLALINQLKHHPQAARTFLGLLQRNPMYRRWASERLQRLDADPTGQWDPEVSLLRSSMVTLDLASSYAPTESLLLQLLRVNRRNRMAFEYLMAYYLMNGQPEKVVQNLGRLRDFEYPSIPRHYEEAWLLHLRLTNDPNLAAVKPKISPPTWQRFQEFEALLTQCQNDSEMARRATAEKFGDTYWYFYMFAENPATASPAMSDAYP